MARKQKPPKQCPACGDDIKGHRSKTVCDSCRNDRDRVRQRLYKEKNPVKLKFLSSRGHAKTRGIEFLLEEEDFSVLLDSECHYCGDKEKLGFDRIDSEGIYDHDNVVPCCSFCNTAKLSYSREYFLDKVAKIAGKHAALRTS